MSETRMGWAQAQLPHAPLNCATVQRSVQFVREVRGEELLVVLVN